MAALYSAFKWLPRGYAQITSLSTAVGFVGAGISIPSDAIIVLIQCEGAAIRWRDDGVAPTATIGMPLAAGQEFQYTVADFSQIQFIQQAVGAIINLNFYR